MHKPTYLEGLLGSVELNIGLFLSEECTFPHVFHTNCAKSMDLTVNNEGGAALQTLLSTNQIS